MTPERDAKLRALISGIVNSPSDLAILTSALEASGLALRQIIGKIPFPAVTDPVRLANARHGIILDTETTGLDPRKDKVVQLAMLRIRYDAAGIIDIGESLNRLIDPGMPISAEATQVTGITDEMVAGKTLPVEEIRAFAAGTDLIVAHNASFDRKMCEASFPGAGFGAMAWHCSIEQVNWLARGMTGKSLETLCANRGYVYGAHDAMNDVLAAAFVLAGQPGDAESPFAEMYRRGREGAVQIIAKGSPFETKDALKENGYFWSDDGSNSGGHVKVWHKTLPSDPALLDAEAAFLREKIFRRDIALPMFHIVPEERYSLRKPSRPDTFTTSEVRCLKDVLAHGTPYSELTPPSLF